MSLSRTGIEYATHAWNPLVGCGNLSCPVRQDCWARAYLRRFHGRCEHCRNFSPHLHGQYDLPKSRKPRVIVANFLGDWLSHPSDACNAALSEMEFHSEDIFLTLTKFAYRLHATLGNPFPAPNVWLGGTYTDSRGADLEFDWVLMWRSRGFRTWVSFEPLLGDPIPRLMSWTTYPDWVVVGALTRNGRTVPPEKGGTRHEWITAAVVWCNEHDVPCFVKDNAEALPGGEFYDCQKELPWAGEVERARKEPK